MGELRMCAVLIRRGDGIDVRGRWLEVHGSRLERFATGGAVVVLNFVSGGRMRVPVFKQLLVFRQAASPVGAQAGNGALHVGVSGPPPVFEVECMTCHTACEASMELDSAERSRRCVRHAWETGHMDYRDTRTGFLRATAS